MKIELWQVLLYVTVAAAILFILCTKSMLLNQRWGLALVLGGFLIASGPATLPRFTLRAHVSNDRHLRCWSDVLVFGLPASLFVWVGLSAFWIQSMFLLSVPYGLAVAVVFFVAHSGWVFNRDEG